MKVIVADATKFDHSAFSTVSSLDGIDVLVTDRRPEGDLLQALEAADVEIVVAD